MKIPRRRILAAMSSSTRPTKVGLATRPPISPGLSRVTGRRETAAVRRQRPKMGTGQRQRMTGAGFGRARRSAIVS
jgi:hypothetical protein